MTQEEKAKAYDEAIEKLRNLHDNYDTVSTLIDIKDELEHIFPELRESEDEKTRKALISFLKSPFVNENITDEKVAPWLAWLEKQGQKSAWSKDDERIYQSIIDDTVQENLLYNEQINWLKSIKQRIS